MIRTKVQFIHFTHNRHFSSTVLVSVFNSKNKELLKTRDDTLFVNTSHGDCSRMIADDFYDYSRLKIRREITEHQHRIYKLAKPSRISYYNFIRLKNNSPRFMGKSGLEVISPYHDKLINYNYYI